MKIALREKDVFAIFDSHSRPCYPHGSGLILNSSICGTAARLSSILPVDSRLMAQINMQWQTQMLANYSAHIFVPQDLNSTSEALTQALVTSSLKVLALQVENADLRSRNSALISKQRQLDAEAETRASVTHKREWLWSFLPSSLLGVNKQYYPESSTESWSATSPGGLSVAEPSPSRQHVASPGPSTYQRSRLATVPPPQRMFTCGVCFEKQPEDFIARIDTCNHQFCRDCIQGHVNSKLQERRFPVMCPSCMMSKSGEPGVVSNSLAQQILTEAQFMIWTELEMVEFSVLLYCQRCKQSGYVDKEDFETADTLSCPFADCQHIWCKACQHSIVIGGPPHSCDGSTEFDFLMDKEGWKYCPSCKTPFMKTEGCNHMTCTSPGCNTHFCYLCGELIIRSTLQSDVSTAILNHFGGKCNM
ncbi:hypothetical protein HWV62_27771 [Athelia sp. TMB]|nr:hypothetical protein HWV62_27771 [Athelia sp. TMB]